MFRNLSLLIFFLILFLSCRSHSKVLVDGQEKVLLSEKIYKQIVLSLNERAEDYLEMLPNPCEGPKFTHKLETFKKYSSSEVYLFSRTKINCSNLLIPVDGESCEIVQGMDGWSVKYCD